MYGTVARIKIKPGSFEEFNAINEEMSPDPEHGAVSVTVFRSNEDPDELYLVVMFEDKKKYYDNAERPETDANFRKMSQFFAEDPQWHDGEVVYFKKFD